MKKLISLILLALILSLTIVNTASAHTKINNKRVTERPIIIAQSDDYVPSTIPRPDYLPGPSEEEQNSTRLFLTERVLPKFGVAVIGLVGAVSLLFLVISGVRFATAYGNDEKIESAKNQAMYAVIGLVIALLSYTIVAIIINLEYEGPETEPQTIENE